MKEINQWVSVPPALLLCCCGAEATAKNDTTQLFTKDPAKDEPVQPTILGRLKSFQGSFLT